MTHRTLITQMLEALDYSCKQINQLSTVPGVAEAITAAREYLAQPEQSEPGSSEITSEQHIALREAHAIGASDAYFEAHPTHDNDAGRMLFERGFVRGFDSHERAVRTARNYPAPPLRELSKGEVIDIAKRCNILDDTELLDSNQWRQDTLRELQAFARAVLAAARSKT